MAAYTDVETVQTGASDNDADELVGSAVRATRTKVVWKISMVVVAILGLAMLGRSAGTWAAAETGSHVPLVEIVPEGLQNKAEQCQSQLLHKCLGVTDPHYTTRFFNLPRLDHYQKGLYTLAISAEKDFEVQGFQCLSGYGISNLAGIAVKVGGKIGTYWGNDDANFKWSGGGSPEEVNVTGSPETGLTIQTSNGCQSLWMKKFTTHMKLRFSLDVEVRTSSPARKGICGLADDPKEVLPHQRLFGHDEMMHMCEQCKLEDCEGTSHTGESPGNAVDQCHKHTIDLGIAKESCSIPEIDSTFTVACIFDYCTGSKEDAVKDAKDLTDFLRAKVI